MLKLFLEEVEFNEEERIFVAAVRGGGGYRIFLTR